MISKVRPSLSDSLTAGSAPNADTLHQTMGIFEVFYQPGKLSPVWRNGRAAWVAPLLLGSAPASVTTVTAVRLIGMETIIRQQLQNTRLTPEQMQTALNQANSPAVLYVLTPAPVVVGLVALLLIAGLLTIFAMVGSKQPKFSTNFSMVTLAFFPYTAGDLPDDGACAVSPRRIAVSLDINNLLATNVGAFVDKETMSKGLYTLLSRFDILTFCGDRSVVLWICEGESHQHFLWLFAVLSLWIVYVLIRMGLSFLF